MNRRIPSSRHIGLAVLFTLAIAVPLAVTLVLTDAESAFSKPQAPEAKPVIKTHRVVLPINTDDPTTMRAVISTALNLPKYYQDRKEQFTIEIVAYNAGLHMFRADTSPVKNMLIVLRGVNPGIRFVVCDLTKAGMERSEGRPMTLIDNVELTPSGPGRIIELQEAGWSYIRS